MTTWTWQPDDTDGVDASLHEAQPNTNYTLGSNFLLCGTGFGYGSGFSQGLIKPNFTLGTNPPIAGAVFLSFSLQLTMYDESSANARTLSVYRLKMAWVETQVTHNDYSTGNNWQTAGALGANDREAAAMGTLALSATEALGDKTITLDPALATAMFNGSFANNGLLFNIGNVSDGYAFRMCDYATAAQRPKFTGEWGFPSNQIIMF